MTVAAIQSPYSKIVEDLAERFAKATQRAGKNTRGTQLYKWQVEFAYLTHEIVSGPTYIAPKIIDNATRFIDGIVKIRKEETTV